MAGLNGQHPEMDIVPHDLPAEERPMKIDTMTRSEFEELEADILGMLEDRKNWKGPPPEPKGDDECDVYLRTRHPLLYNNFEMTYMQIRDQRIPEGQLLDFVEGLRQIVYGAEAGDKKARRKIYDREVMPRDWYAFARGITPAAYQNAMKNAMMTDEGKKHPDRVRQIMGDQWRKARTSDTIEWDGYLVWRDNNKIPPMTPGEFAANVRISAQLDPGRAKVEEAAAREAWAKRWHLVNWEQIAQTKEPMEFASEVRSAQWLTPEDQQEEMRQQAREAWDKVRRQRT